MEKNALDMWLEGSRLLFEALRSMHSEEIRKAEAQKQEEPNKEWIRAEEAAKRFPVPRTWFEKAGRDGLIERTRAGKYVFFRVQSIEKYFESHQKRGM